MRVCYFGKYDPAYSRNAVIRKGLAQNGVQVVECRIAGGLGMAQYRGLLAQMRQVKGHLDVILVAEHNQFVVPLAWAWAWQRRARLVFDPFTSLYDSDVMDRRVVAPGSLTARRRFWLDVLSMRLADTVLADTDQHRRYFAATFGLRLDKVHVVPVGADDDLYAPRPRQGDSSRFLALFWGTYIPLHGVETILRAAHLLRDPKSLSEESWGRLSSLPGKAVPPAFYTGSKDITIELIGDGQMYAAMRRLADELGLPATLFRPRIPRTQLPDAIAPADVCLGIFGDTAKARRAVPNKVYEALAMGKPVITGDSPAVREFFTPGEHLRTVPMADSQALAEAILALKGNPTLREALAAQGHARFCECFTPQVIGYRVKQLLDQII